MKKENLYSRNKLFKHLDRLTQLNKTGFTYPILVNFNVSNICNNNCPLCTTRLKNGSVIPLEKVKEVILQLKEEGIKAITYGGGGEPSCHPNLKEIIKFTKENEIEVALTTNGYLMSDELINTSVKLCTWIRISLDANSPETYEKTHGMPKNAFYQTIANIEKLTKTKKNLNSNVIIGITYLIGQHTIDGIYNAAELSKKLGVDYIRFRPFFNWGGRILQKQEKQKMFLELKKAKELESDNFSVSYTKDRCETITGKKQRNYKQCNVHHFVSLITADLKLYPCCLLEGNEKYCFGNLNNNAFKEIWESEKRKQVCNNIDLENDCPNPCMLDKHNELLWQIKQPVQHENFL